MSTLKDRSAAPRVPDLSHPSGAGLSYLLRHRELWPKGFNWDYGNFKTCAIGLAQEVWVEDFKNVPQCSFGQASTYAGDMGDYFGLSPSNARWVFRMSYPSGDYPTPIEVANRLDKALADA